MGCFAIMMTMPQHLKLSHLTKQENYVLIGFSFLFTINIAISNVSLYDDCQLQQQRHMLTSCRAMVSVPFHQIARSTTPVAAVIIYKWYGRTYATATYLALIPIIFGVGLSTYGDYYATLLGASLTFLGTFLAAAKVSDCHNPNYGTPIDRSRPLQPTAS